MAKKRKLYVKETQMENTQETTQVESEALQEAIVESTTTTAILVEEEPTQASDAVVEDTVIEPVVEEPVAQAQSVPEPLVSPVAAPVAPVSEYSDNLTQILTMVKQTNNAPVINYINELMDYAKKMAPAQTMNSEAGAINQAGLYTTIVNIIDHSGADFRIAFSALLCIFHEYRNAAFGGAYVLRFMDSVSLNSARRKAFIKIVNLLSMTANPKTRKAALKHIDLKREILPPFGEASRMRIESYLKG